jgi:regulatory protein
MGGAYCFMDDLDKTKKAALRLLNFRPRSENELRRRLTQKNLPREAVEATVDQLKKEGWVDDEKFARLYALSRMQSGSFGKGRVRRELTQRGLSGALIESGMTAIADIDEAAAAQGLVEKRLATMRGLSLDAKKRRLHGFLMRRGFSSQVIFRVLGKFLGAMEEE